MVTRQRLAVRHLALAVAVAVLVAELVEQRACGRGIVGIDGRERRVMTREPGREGCAAGSAWPWRNVRIAGLPIVTRSRSRAATRSSRGV